MATTYADPSWVVTLDYPLGYVDGAVEYRFDGDLWVALAVAAITGTSATTNANDTSTASGTYTPEAITGTSTTTNAADTSTASGTYTPEAITGTSATTNAADTSTASGIFDPGPITGTSTTTNANDTSTASGTAGVLYGQIHAIYEPSIHVVQEGRMSARVTTAYLSGDEDPGIAYTLKDRDGTVVDFSSATFSMVIDPVGSGSATTKTTNITGSASAPNVVVTWATGELATLGAGEYSYTITGIVSGRSRTIGAGAPHRLIVV